MENTDNILAKIQEIEERMYELTSQIEALDISLEAAEKERAALIEQLANLATAEMKKDESLH